MASGEVLTGTDDRVLSFSSAIERLIQTTRRLLRSTWIATGLCVSLGLFLIALVAMCLLDLGVPLGAALRFMGLLIIAVPTTWAFTVGVLRPLFRRLTKSTVARRIEQEIPGIHNRLVSCIDLSEKQSRTHSQAFYRRLIQEAYERVRDFRPRRVLDLITLRNASLFALVSILAFALAWFSFPNRLPTAMARMFMPFADIPPASGVLYDVLIGANPEPGDCEVLRGEDIDFTVILREGQVDPPGGDDPLRVEVSTVDDEGLSRTLRYNFPALEKNTTFFKLTGMRHDLSYRVFGGGTWSRKYYVRMLDRPRIVGLQTLLHYPTYMRMSEPRLGPPQSADVTGPVDSTVEVLVDVEGDASEGEIQILQRQSKLVDVLNREERVWFADEMPAGAAGHGTWAWNQESLEKRAHTDAAAAGAHAHGFEKSPIPFEVLPGESLFAEVYIPADQVPESIMLKFHDGTGWEHRAFWGADKIAEGTAETASRFRVGDLPSTGKLVRLEVPAEAVGLDGGKIHGVSFAVFGGQAIWGSTGSLPPARTRVSELAVKESFLMQESQPKSSESGQLAKWKGTFPLTQDGYYRVVLRNRLKYPNQQMQEGKLTAIPDLPPQIVIEKPIRDLVVSEPVRVPVFMSGWDDYGIDEITLSVQLPDAPGFQGRPVRKFEKPQQNEHAVIMMDLAEEGVKLDQTLRYRFEVRDTKGQTATTPDYTIRIANDNNAADQQFTRYQEKTKTLLEKFEQLVQEQAKVEEKADELEAKYADLQEKIEQAQQKAADEAEKFAEANPDQPAPLPAPVTLDEAAQQELQQLREELKQVTPLEDRAVQLAQEVATELQQVADQAEQLDFLAPEIAEQMQGIDEAFQDLAVTPMQELRDLVNQGTQPNQQDPQLPQIEAQSDDIMETLSDIEDRIAAVSEAQELSRQNVEEAVAEMQQDILQQNAGIANRELAELRDAIQEMRNELGELQQDQQALMADADKDLSDPLFEALQKAQENLEGQAEPVLEDVQDLLASEFLADVREQAEQMRFEPALAEAMMPEAGEDGSEPEGNEPAGNEPAGNEPAGNEPAGNEPAGDEPAGNEPAGNEPARNEPAGDEPAGNEPAGNEPAGNEPAGNEPAGNQPPRNPERQQFEERQQEQSEEIASAEAALAADQEILEELIASLAAQLPDGEDAEMTAEQAAQLQRLLNADTTREALAMFQRLQQMLNQQDQAQAQAQPNQPQQPQQAQAQLTKDSLLQIGEQTTVVGGVEKILLELGDFDLNQRTVIMKMQPREREDLLQGLREEGPEGYRKFIRDYFQRLTKVQALK